jgi:hypothetical protein
MVRDKDKGIYAADAAGGAEFDELNRSGLPVCTSLELVLPELVDALISLKAPGTGERTTAQGEDTHYQYK